ncbi:hypothetical protein CFC21_081434, partial [Triticum aestivum]
LLEGASVGPLIELPLDFDPSILMTGFVGTAIALGCFSGAAIIAKHREYLYLGGLPSSGLSILKNTGDKSEDKKKRKRRS